MSFNREIIAISKKEQFFMDKMGLTCGQEVKIKDGMASSSLTMLKKIKFWFSIQQSRFCWDFFYYTSKNSQRVKQASTVLIKWVITIRESNYFW